MTDGLDRLIECLGCGEHFIHKAQFETHLKLVHAVKLKEYLEHYPNAQVEPLPPDPGAPPPLFPTRPDVEEEEAGPPVDLPPLKFNPSDITDPDYIKAALKEYPEKWTYFESLKEELMSSGIPDCKALDQFALISVFVRDTHLKIMSRPDKDGRFYMDSNEVKVFKEITDTQKKLLDTIKGVFEKTTKERSIDQELEKLMSEAEIHVRQTLGEQAFMCHNCGAMIDTSGFAHWAFEIYKDVAGKNIYLLWSELLWELVVGFDTTDLYDKKAHHQIPIWYMACALQTSIEGLMHTAKEKKMEVERSERNDRMYCKIDGYEFDIGHEEEQLKLAYDRYKEIYHGRSIRDIG